MAEGEQLSKKQLAQENTIKKLRQQIKDVEVSRKELATEAMLVRKNLDETTQSKASLEEELTVARTNHQAELDSEVAHYQDLLSKARAAQVSLQNSPSAQPQNVSYLLNEAQTCTGRCPVVAWYCQSIDEKDTSLSTGKAHNKSMLFITN